MILWFKSSGTAAHIYQVDACLETSGALKVATQLHILVPEKKKKNRLSWCEDTLSGHIVCMI